MRNFGRDTIQPLGCNVVTSHAVFYVQVLTVKKNYRDVTYHNWRHAFNVTQTMFLMLKENREFKNNFSDEEKFAMVVGCLCHDLDHRGLNNIFQVRHI